MAQRAKWGIVITLRPFVRPSVNFSLKTFSSETAEENFTKLGILIRRKTWPPWLKIEHTKVSIWSKLYGDPLYELLPLKHQNWRFLLLLAYILKTILNGEKLSITEIILKKHSIGSFLYNPYIGYWLFKGQILRFSLFGQYLQNGRL